MAYKLPNEFIEENHATEVKRVGDLVTVHLGEKVWEGRTPLQLPNHRGLAYIIEGMVVWWWIYTENCGPQSSISIPKGNV